MARQPLSLIAVLFSVAPGAAAPPLPADPPSIVLTARENGTEPDKEFLCDGRVHGYLRLPAPVTGRHVLEGIWILPSGKEISHSRTVLEFPPPGRSTAYLWFQFAERGSLLKPLHPEADAERASYEGNWRLEVRWDEQPLLQTPFRVICP